jgi:hypothetical protein
MEAAGAAGEASTREAVVIRAGRSETKTVVRVASPAHVEEERGRTDSGHVASAVR